MHRWLGAALALLVSSATAMAATAFTPVGSNNVPLFTRTNPGYIFSSTIPVTVKTANYTITTSDCGTVILAGTGSTGSFTVTLPSASGFSSGCLVTVKNGDTAANKTLSGFPSDISTTLLSQQAISVVVANGVWESIYNRAAFSTGTVSTKSTDYTVIETDDRNAIHLTGSQKTLTLGAPSTYLDPSFAVSFCNLSATNTNTVSANGATRRLYPGQCGSVQKPATGTAWLWYPQQNVPYTVYNTGATLYVSTSGNDSNDGLTLSTPLRLIATAISRACTDFNNQGRNINIQLADGLYNENIGVFGQCGNRADGLSINGHAGSPISVRIVGTIPGGTTAQSRDQGILFLSNLAVSCASGTADGIAVAASQTGVVDFDDVEVIGCDFGIMMSATEGGHFNAVNVLLSSNALEFFQAQGPGSKMVLSGTMTCDGIISASIANISLLDNAVLYANDSTWSGCGSMVAKKYDVSYGAGLVAGAVTIPGGTAGTVDATTFGWKR